MSGNKIGEQMDGWHAIEYKEYVQVFEPICAPYMRLYKKSTKHAAQKARHFIDKMNSKSEWHAIESEKDKEIRILKDALEQKDKDSTKLQFELAEQITKLKESNAELRAESDRYATKARRAEEQFWYMRSVIENQSVALRNISNSLEK